MPYSEKTDLLVGDLLISEAFDKGSFVQTAFEEIQAKLGFFYELPLHVETADPIDENSWKALPEHQQLLLKGINNKLASGRLILALAAADEQSSLHGYGWQLVKEATAELVMVANGEVLLSAVKLQYDGSALERGPTISNHDEASMVYGFEENVMRRSPSLLPTYVQPGESYKGFP